MLHQIGNGFKSIIWFDREEINPKKSKSRCKCELMDSH